MGKKSGEEAGNKAITPHIDWHFHELAFTQLIPTCRLSQLLHAYLVWPPSSSFYSALKFWWQHNINMRISIHLQTFWSAHYYNINEFEAAEKQKCNS